MTAAQKKTYGSFDEMISESPEPILVDFYATWCEVHTAKSVFKDFLKVTFSDKDTSCC